MFSSRLFWRVFGVYALLSLVATAVFLAVISGRLRSIVVAQLRQRLHDSAVLLRDEVEPTFATAGSAELQQRLSRLGEENQTRITLIAADGRVIGDSDHDPETMDDHSNREELVQAGREGRGFAQRESPTLGVPMMYYALRVGEEDRPAGYVRVALPMDAVDEQVASIQRMIWGTAAAVMLGAALVTALVVGRITRPLTELTKAAETVTQGDYNITVFAERRDELGKLANAFNSMTGELGVRIDQLQQKQEESEERGKLLQTVFSTMVEGVVAVDSRQRILIANRAAHTLFDFSLPEVVGRPFWEVTRSAKIQEAVENVLQGKSEERREFQLPRTKSVAMLVASRLPGDPTPGVVLVLHDVTELRRLENLRRDFVSNVSPELKTPLTTIQACAETLQSGAIDDPQHNREFVQQIAEQADRLHALILDLLALGRIESGQDAFDVTPVSVEQVITACLDEHRAVAQSQGVSIDLQPHADGIRVRADAEGLRTVLDNLLDNAIKYTPENGRVTVGWAAEDDFARIDVIDTGIGIPEEHQERVFERFYRADKARSRELGGTGLGLAIVKHHVQVFGGRVELESTPGEGSRFTVWLPIAK